LLAELLAVGVARAGAFEPGGRGSRLLRLIVAPAAREDAMLVVARIEEALVLDQVLYRHALPPGLRLPRRDDEPVQIRRRVPGMARAGRLEAEHVLRDVLRLIVGRKRIENVDDRRAYDLGIVVLARLLDTERELHAVGALRI